MTNKAKDAIVINSTIIEDDPIQAAILSAFLESNNIGVQVIDNYEQACHLITNGLNTDLVLLDYDLNSDNGDGIDLCDKIVSSSNAPVFVLTGYDHPELAADFLNAGARQFLKKPFSYQNLLVRIRKIAASQRKDLPKAEEQEPDKPDLDINRGMVHFKDTSIRMSRKEIELFELFLENEGDIVFREDINFLLNKDDSNSRYADTLVTKLRRRLPGVGGGYRINSVRGSGYQLLRKDK